VLTEDVPDGHVQVRTTCPACGLIEHEPECPVGRQQALIVELGLDDGPVDHLQSLAEAMTAHDYDVDQQLGVDG
jgi:hypothetical protein